MSTTAGEVRGPNTALFRATALVGSAFIWSSLGYLALTYVPTYESSIDPPELILESFTPPKPIIIPPPLPILPPTIRDTPDVRVQAPVDARPTLTTRTPNSTKKNPLSGELPAGPVASAPSVTGGGPIDTPITAWVDPPPILAAPIEIVPPPAPKLVINPVRLAGTNPTFPNRALDLGVSGEVTLSFTVSPMGQVENINVTGETPTGYGFARAAREAIQNWTFQPQTIDGVPVAYPARYTISFKLED